MTPAHAELPRELQSDVLTAPTAQLLMERIAKRLHEKMTRYNWGLLCGLLASSVLLTIAVILLLLNYSRLGDLFHSHVRDRPKRRLFLAPIGFFVTFALARAMAYGAYRNVAPDKQDTSARSVSPR